MPCMLWRVSQTEGLRRSAGDLIAAGAFLPEGLEGAPPMIEVLKRGERYLVIKMVTNFARSQPFETRLQRTAERTGP